MTEERTPYGDTPRTDAALYAIDGGLPLGSAWKIVEHARQLERELAEARRDVRTFRQALIMIDAQAESQRVWGGQSYRWHFPQAKAIHDITRTALEMNAAIDAAIESSAPRP